MTIAAKQQDTIVNTEAVNMALRECQFIQQKLQLVRSQNKHLVKSINGLMQKYAHSICEILESEDSSNHDEFGILMEAIINTSNLLDTRNFVDEQHVATLLTMITHKICVESNVHAFQNIHGSYMHLLSEKNKLANTIYHEIPRVSDQLKQLTDRIALSGIESELGILQETIQYINRVLVNLHDPEYTRIAGLLAQLHRLF